MLSTVVTITLFGFGFNYVLNYREWLDWDKDLVLSIKPGSCESIIKEGGSEDLTHIGNGIVLMSTGFELFESPGQIKAVDLNNGNKVTTLNVTNVPSRKNFLSAPHGITTLRDPDTGKLFLYVICHPKPEDQIEVFEVLKSLTLKHVRTITDRKFGLVVYVAEWGTKTLRGFRRDSSNNLVEIWSTYTGTGIDNIEVDPDSGDLWIGSHPITWKIVNPLTKTVPPGEVVRVKIQDNAVSEMEIIYQDDGTNCAGSAAATYAAGKLIVGTVKKQTVVCDVKYLSPN